MSFSAVCRAAEEYQRLAKAPFAFLFRDLGTGETVHYHGDEPFPTASSFKVFILAALYRKAALGELSLDDRLPLRDEYKALGSGVLSALGEGLAPTLKDLALLMMMISDNTATDMLFDLVGKDCIREQVIEPLGLARTRCDLPCKDLIDKSYELEGRTIEEMFAAYGGQPSYRNSPYYTCEAEENDQSSPLDMLKMYETLYRGEWVDRETSDAMLDVLKQCQTNSRIPYELPPFTTVAHKTGTLDRLAVDTGIVYTQKGDYFLAMFYNGNLAGEADYDADPAGHASDRFLAAWSGAVYRAYMEE